MAQPGSALLKTPLNGWHRAHARRMAAFSGWDLPFEFSGAVSEHLAVRTAAGLFDASHMGQVEVAGRDASAAVQHAVCSDVTKVGAGQSLATLLVTPAGGVMDDVSVFRLGRSHFMLVVTAANTAGDVAWLASQAQAFGDVAVLNTSARYAMLGFEGPVARQVLQPLTGIDLENLEPSWFAHGEVAGVRATVCSCGYTGEAGYRILVPPASATNVWQALLGEGEDAGVRPVGLAALDALRLEAGAPLHGQDVDESTSVIEAGFEGLVDWQKGEFVGRPPLEAQNASGADRRLVGFEVADRGVARRGDGLFVEGRKVGAVTSGTLTPFVKKAIGLGYLPIAHTQPGTEFEIDVRGRRAKARVVPLPFYTRAKR